MVTNKTNTMNKAAAGNNKPAGRRKARFFAAFAVVLLLCSLLAAPVCHAATVTFDIADDSASLDSLHLLGVFTLLALLPSILIMFTCFTRIVIVLSLVRNAIGLQNTPPNQVIIGLALFLSLFIMNPVIKDVNNVALQPYLAQEITADEALDAAQDPIKEFMLSQTKSDDLNLFLSLSEQETQDGNGLSQEELLDLGLEVITPAFITSEISRAFIMGFFLYLPFMVIDMIVSSTLMSVGMVMLPPSMISLPFKLMLFVVVDGWRMIMEMLIVSYTIP